MNVFGSQWLGGSGNVAVAMWQLGGGSGFSPFSLIKSLFFLINLHFF
jgi:hypothetical protein